MVAFDNTVLSILLFEDADLQQGPDGQKVDRARERVLALVRDLDEARERVIVPSPALAECLVTDGANMQDILTTLRGSAYIRIEGFDERAAVELAMRLREARKAGNSRAGLTITKNEMKFDRQIVAIALVNEASVLYSDDIGVATFARGCGLKVKGIIDLPVPMTQQSLELIEARSEEEPDTGEPADATQEEESSEHDQHQSE